MSKHVFDKTKWQKMDVFNQMGNIGSEVGRTVKALAGDRSHDAQAAFYRGLDLIDASLDSPEFKNVSRKQELARAREQFAQVYIDEDEKLGRLLEDYFMQFAIAARMRKFK